MTSAATATSSADEAARVDYVPGPAVGVELAAEAASALREHRLRARTGRALARITLDVSMLALGAVVAESGWRAAGFEPSPLAWVIAFPVLALALLYLRGGYAPRIRTQLLDEIRTTVGATAIAAMAVTTGRVVVSDDPIPSAQTVRPWLFATGCLVAGRAVLRWADIRARRRGETASPTVILGAGRVGQLVARRLVQHPEFGLVPIGFLDKEPLGSVEGVPVLGASWDLERVVAEHGVENVIVTFSTAPHEVLLRLAKRCEELGVDISFVPRLFERIPERLSVDHLGGIPLLTPRAANPRGWQFGVKYAFDRLVAALLLLALSPVLLVAILAVAVSTGRPIFFRQSRIGLDGREFGMLKFRTMHGCPEDGGEADADWAAREIGEEAPPFAPSSEDRRTPIGRLLRRTSLDELPQLWNVLRGDMSLVGPRPERAHYVRRFEQSLYRYAERHRVKSGMTGWAQVNGLRGKTSLADRIEWDNYYIENWSLWLDVKILLRTALAVVRTG